MQAGRGEDMKTREKIYQAIIDFMLEHNYPPSTRDIMVLTGIKSTSTVNWHLYVLQKDGRIDQKMSQPRTITVPGIRYIDERGQE